MRSRDYEDGYDRALAEAAVSVQTMDKKLKDMERQLMWLIAASGGRVVVPRSLMQRFDRPIFERSFDPENDAVVYRVTV